MQDIVSIAYYHWFRLDGQIKLRFLRLANLHGEDTSYYDPNCMQRGPYNKIKSEQQSQQSPVAFTTALQMIE
jgi:hypothetical protein